jgi:light-regulated signal transduction histidine kinase (bacteriophytochrome)
LPALSCFVQAWSLSLLPDPWPRTVAADSADLPDSLYLSKVEASQLELERTGFSLNDHLEKVTEMVAARAHEKGLTLVCEIAPNVPTDLVGDPTRLRQVLLNLLGSAIKFTQSGEVSLRVEPDENPSVPTALRFTISDTGIGIPGEKLGHVFERFTQADSSTTRRFRGSGLGLTISKRLVELMDGRIWVESEIGEGSVFAFAVPFEIWATANRPAVALVGTGPEEVGAHGRESWDRIQAIWTTIDDYAGLETGNREYFWNRPHSIG